MDTILAFSPTILRMEALTIRPGLTIPARDLSWSAITASGPGGQHVNKTATKVELRFDFMHCEVLDANVRARLRALAARHLDASGRLVVTSQASRSQSSNLDDARRKLALLIRTALYEPRTRRPTHPSAALHRRRIANKRQRADVKRLRRSPGPED